MKKSLKIAAVCAVSLAMGILCALVSFGVIGKKIIYLSPVSVESFDSETIDYGIEFVPDLITNSWYYDTDDIYVTLKAQKKRALTGTVKHDVISDQIYKSINNMGSFSRYYQYNDKLCIEKDGVRYGAYVNEGDSPIGGGVGYKNIVTTGDYIVSDAKEFLEALEVVKSGEVIFIKGDAVIELTMISAEKGVLKIPSGVTLASDRGRVMEDGTVSRGAVFIERHLSGRVFEVYGNARITGLTLQGANPNRCLPHHYRSFSVPNPPMHAYYNKLTTASTDGFVIMESGVEIDNCEITGFGHAAIFINHGEIKDIHVHHCYIHHNQTQGRGYGISHGNGAVSLVEYNLFNYNRHSIASTGAPPTAYVARYNVEMGESLQHCFDMHGGGDFGRTDGTNIAGVYCEMYNNTFLCDANPYLLRGVPLEYQFFRNNVLINNITDYNWSRLNGENVEIKDNVYNLKSGELRIQ